MNERVKFEVEHLREQERLKSAENSAVVSEVTELIPDDIFESHPHESAVRSHHKKVKK